MGLSLIFEKLYTIAHKLNRCFPDGIDPFQIMTRLLEEGGGLAQWPTILMDWYQAGKMWLTEQSQTRQGSNGSPALHHAIVMIHEIEDDLENKIMFPVKK